MPVTFTDEQLSDVKIQLESGTIVREILEGMGLRLGDRRALLRELRQKYGAETVGSMLARSRPVPTFERLSARIASQQARLSAADLDVMEANLDAAKAEVARIRSEL